MKLLQSKRIKEGACDSKGEWLELFYQKLKDDYYQAYVIIFVWDNKDC
jgi:hypothetical protein